MSIAVRTLVVLLLAFLAALVYSAGYANLSLVRDGCFGIPALGLNPDSGTVHLKAFPPRYVCEYRMKNGRVVERSH